MTRQLKLKIEKPKYRSTLHRALSYLTCLMLMGTQDTVQATDACNGSDQDWFFGWLDTAQMTNQVIDFSHQEDRVLIGGYTANPAAFTDGTLTSVDSSDSKAAIVVEFRENTKSPYRVIVVSRITQAGTTLITGVRQVVHVSAASHLILFETDQDASSVTIGEYQGGQLRFNKMTAIGGAQLSTNNFIDSYQTAQHLLIGTGTQHNNSILYAFSFVRAGSSLDLQASVALADLRGTHTLHATLQLSDSFFSVSTGQCTRVADSFSNGLMIAEWAYDSVRDITYTGARCFDLDDPVFTAAFGSGTIKVSSAVAYDGGKTAIFLEGASPGSFITLGLEKIGSLSANAWRHMENLPASSSLQIVHKTSASSEIVHIVIKSSSEYLLIYDFKVGLVSDTSHSVFSVALTSNMADASYLKHDLSDHLIAGISGSSTNYLTVMTSTDFFRFTMESASAQTNQCITANFTPSTTMTETVVLSPPTLHDQSDPGQDNILSNHVQVVFETTTEFTINPNSHYNQNACDADHTVSIFSDTSHQIGELTPTELDTNDIVRGTCPGITSLTYADTKRFYPTMIQDPTGTNHSVTNLFTDLTDSGAIVWKISPQNTLPPGTYTLQYQVGLLTQSDAEIQALPFQTVEITLLPCTFTLPATPPESTYTYGEAPLTLTFSGYSSSCLTVQQVTYQDGSSIESDLFTFTTVGIGTDTLTVEMTSPNLDYEKTFDLKYVIAKSDDVGQNSELEFSVTVRMSPCTKVWDYPTVAPYDFAEVTYVVQEDSIPVLVEFTDIDLTNCPFLIQVLDVDKTLETGTDTEIDSGLVTIVQPTLHEDPTDARIVSVTSYGGMIVDTRDNNYLGTYTLSLRVFSQRFPGDVENQTIAITLNINECVNVAEDSSVEDLGYLSYTLGDELIELVTVQRLSTNCKNSDLTVAEGLDPSFTVDLSSDSITVSLESTEIIPGNHIVTVLETDRFTGFAISTSITVEVFEQPEESSSQATEQPAEDSTEDSTDESSQESQEETGRFNVTEAFDLDLQVDILVEETITTEDIVEIEESEPAEPFITIGKDGQPIYPWQRSEIQSRKQKVDTVGEKKEIVPLKAFAKEMSATGNFKIGFNKPILFPPFKMGDQKNSTRMLLDDDSLEDQDSEEDFYLDIENVLDLSVESSFFEDGSTEILIANFSLTGMSERQLDISINFQLPKKITQIVSEPDQINIKLRNGRMFMDSRDFTQLNDTVSFFLTIPPQISASELEELEKLGESVASSMSVLSVCLLALQIFLAMGLKYLWNIMNLLQFLIFMQMWLISLPHTTKVVLGELKSLALLEFIPTDYFIEQLKSLLGVEAVQDDYQLCDVSITSESTCQGDDEQSDLVTEKSDIGRTGSSSLIDNMGTMLVIAVAILFILLLLLLLKLCASRVQCVRRLYQSIKRKLFYNTFLRFVLQSTLKLQFAACTVIAYDELIAAEASGETQKTEGGSNMTAGVILGVLNLCPLLFFWILQSNKQNLHKEVIKNKIGTLYNGMRPKQSGVVSYAPVFLVRRSLFVLITFSLFEQPGIQVQLMIYMTLLYVIYLGHSEFFEFSAAKSLEIFNESIFVLIQYNFVLLHNLVEDEVAREQLGNVIVGLTSLLLLFNMLVILVVSIRALCRKCFLRSLKRKAIRDRKARQSLKVVLSTQLIVAKTVPVSSIAVPPPSTADKPRKEAQQISSFSSISYSEQSVSNQSCSSDSKPIKNVAKQDVARKQKSQMVIINKDDQKGNDLQLHGNYAIDLTLSRLMTHAQDKEQDHLMDNESVPSGLIAGSILLSDHVKLPSSRVIQLHKKSKIEKKIVEQKTTTRPLIQLSKANLFDAKFRSGTINYEEPVATRDESASKTKFAELSSLVLAPLSKGSDAKPQSAAETAEKSPKFRTTLEVKESKQSFMRHRQELLDQTKFVIEELSEYHRKYPVLSPEQRYNLRDD